MNDITIKNSASSSSHKRLDQAGFRALATGLTLALSFSSFVEVARAQVSGDVVKIGVLDDYTGPYSDNDLGSDFVAQMAIDDFGGTVLGKRIQLVKSDHQNKSDVAMTIARKWFDTENVDMITGLANSSVALAVQELAKSKGRVTIVNAAGSTELTGKSCSPTGFHWTYDTYALANGTGKAVVKGGGDSWFFITADYAFGHSLQKDTEEVVAASGGKVIGSVRHPLNSSDFASYLVQAQSSKAKIVAMANAGNDTINAVKQASEFGIVKGGQNLAGLLVFFNNVVGLGLAQAQGLLLTTAFYWDMNAETRAWSQRFFDRYKIMPNMLQAGQYGAVQHYLRAVAAAGTDDAGAVAAKMKALPVNDFFTKNGVVRDDGRVVRDMYLAKVKTPKESKGPWDLYEIVQTIPGSEAYRPLSASECPLVKK